MRMLPLLCLCSALLLLPACDDFDGPPPIGSVRAVDPEADALMAKADAAQKAGKLGREISALKELVEYHELAPNAAQARFRLGQAYEKDEEYRDAFKQYTKLIERYPQSPLYTDALNRQLALGMAGANGTLRTPVLWGAWHAEMESSVVIEWLRTVIAKAPYNDMAATASSILAKYLVDIEKFDDARTEYRRLVENYPDSRYAPESQLMLAQLWANDHTRGDRNLVNLTNAREAYEEFTLRFPNHPDAAKARAQAADMKSLLVQQELEVGRYYLERSREYTSAIFCFENVIRQKQQNPKAAAEAAKLLEQARARAAQPGNTIL
ncbi:MAG: outer membrane protein assembly factor BamD [Akkermansia sp.]